MNNLTFSILFSYLYLYDTVIYAELVRIFGNEDNKIGIVMVTIMYLIVSFAECINIMRLFI